MLTKLLNLIAKSERIDQTIESNGLLYRIAPDVELRGCGGDMRVIVEGLEIGFLRSAESDVIREALWERQAAIKSERFKLFLAS